MSRMITPKRAALAAVAGLCLALVPATGSSAQDPASVTIVHGIPSVGAVDVCANDSVVLVADVSYGGVATIPVPAGTYDLTVKAAVPGDPCTGATAITLNGATIPAGANISAVANLTGGTPNIAVFTNDVSEIAAGKGRVAVYHAANAPTVDVLVNGDPGINDLAQGQVANADLPAGSYTFTVTSADGSITVATLNDVAVPAGKLLQVFAVGAYPDESQQNPFGVITNTIDLPVAQAATTTTTAPTPTTTAPAAAATATPSYTG